MLSKWEKTPYIIKFTILTVDIKKNIDDQFTLNWQRGKYKGSTSRVIAMNQMLTFNESFKCKCTMYIEKNSQVVREKDIKFILNRVDPSNNEMKVFGKVKINLSQFFGKTVPTTCTVSMTTKRSKAPIITAVFAFRNTGQSEIVEDIKEIDFQSSLDSIISSDKWDTTESLPSSSPPASSTSSSTMPAINQNNKGKSQLSKFQKKNIIGKNSSPASDVSPLIPSKNLMDFMGMRSREHLKFFESVLSVSWPLPVTPSFISMPYQYPPAVFPLFSTFLKSQIFESNEAIEKDLYESILQLMENAPLSISCTNEKRFITFLLLYILLNHFTEKYNLDKDRIQNFSQLFLPMVDRSLLSFGKLSLGRLEQFYTHFLNSSAEVPELLSEYQTNVKEVTNFLMLPAPIKNIVIKAFNSMVDARLLSKMISSPSLLTFKNAMLWSSFMTALESSGDSLLLSSEASRMLMMAPTIGLQPDLSQDVCPNLSPDIVLFLLVHVRPDDLQAQPIDASKFIEHYGITEEENQIGEIIPALSIDYLSIADNLRLKDWCRCELQGEVLARFPYFKEYMKAEPSTV